MKLSKNATAVIASVLLFFTACKKSDDSTITPQVTFKNHIAYLYKQDNTDALAYKALLEKNNCAVTPFDMSQAGAIDFKQFDLVVIGKNTATDKYDFAGITGAVSVAGKPVLMIGEGGGHYGEMVNAAVNWESCNGKNISAALIVVDSTMSIYKSPKKIAVPANRQLAIYNVSSFAEVFNESPYINYANVVPIAQASTAYSNEFSVTCESGKYGYWGYYDNVNLMTQTGKDFMVNLSYYVGKLSL